MARRMNYQSVRGHELARLTRQQERDQQAFTYDLDRKRWKRPLPIGPSKTQLRQELARLAPDPLPPWGAWSPWTQVTKANGEVYWQRSCSRVGHERGTNQEHGRRE